MKKLRRMFARVSRKAAQAAGSSTTFVLAVLTVVVWGVLGPLFEYSNTWQLVINTFTTIVTFLLAISIQHTQNKDAKALHLKLNELLSQTEDLQEALTKIEKELEEEDDD